MLNLLITLALALAPEGHPETGFERFMQEFGTGYDALEIGFPPFDYRDELRAIPSPDELEEQRAFFEEMKRELEEFDPKDLSPRNRMHLDHLRFEIEFNLERTELYNAWRASDVAIPTSGLSTVPEGWYDYRVKRFTSTEITPAELLAFGTSEVARVKGEIRRLRVELGYAQDSVGFYKHLTRDTFLLTDKDAILARYEAIKETVLQYLPVLFSETDVSDVEFMEWPGADRFTPPGYYSPATTNAYNIPVFHFNFHNGRHNVRAMEWLFLHEAIPGHHYQWWLRERLEAEPAFKRHFSYPGNFEGWAAYVEYHGKALGVYADPWSELGKWEWDLVRSVRILIDVGIHHLGWSQDEALACWRKHIPGQDEIAEREVVRCTNWPGQALSYKVGAWRIGIMAERLREADEQFSPAAFHHAYLSAGQTPVAVIEEHLNALMSR